MKDNLPTFHINRDSVGGGGHCDIYKRSTTKFWNWMKQTLPGHKINSVNDLSKGIDEV
jgi:hypothetical protein